MTLEQVLTLNRKNVFVGRSQKGYGQTYFAAKEFKKGDLVMAGYGQKIDHQTSHISVQISAKEHYKPTKWSSRYWNHSCNPNTKIVTRSDGFPNLVALKNIKKGDEITYAYWMTEYAWTKNADENRVKCRCGDKSCKGKIFAFSQLPKDKQKKIRQLKMCSQYLLNLP